MIAVDAMGGDFAPASAVQGSYNAARKGIPVTLFGQEKTIIELLHAIDPLWKKLPLSVVDCPNVIGMAEEPTRSILKKDSSLMRALHAVKNQQAKAVVSAGNSGSAVVGSIVIFERVPGIMRPALGTFLPTKTGSVFMMDIGANVDCKPDYLQQFACMGHLFVQQMKMIDNPRIALLSNGHERGKGCHATKQAYLLLEQSSLHFIGNIESRDIFNDYADVIVCDGFVGNLILKAIQGTSTALTSLLKQSLVNSLWGKCVGYMAKPFFKKVQQDIDYRHVGGALLLGVNYPLIVAHGCSNSVAFENALVFAHNVASNSVIQHYNEKLVKLVEREDTIKKTLTVPYQEMVLS